MSRADIAREDRRDFYLYIDEFQNFATKAFATILSEARKYKTKEELIAAFKHAVEAKDAFESLVKGKMSKADFEKQGYKLAEIV